MSDLPPTSEYPQYGPPSNDPTQAQAYPQPPAPAAPPQAPGYAPGQAPGQAPGYAPGQAPGYAPGQAPGYAPGQAPGYAPGQAPGQAPGYAPGQAPVYGQQPVSGPPQGYGQPEYAPQPGWQQQPPYLQQAEQPKSRKTLWITLSVVAVLLLGLCGAGIVGVVYWQNKSNEASTTPSASSKSAPTPTKSTAAPKSNVTLSAPDTIGNRKKNNDSSMKALMEGMKSNFNGLGSVGEPVVAVYGDMGKGDMMMVIAFPQPVPGDSQIVLDSMFKGMEGAGTGTISNKTSVDPGKLGGAAQCADVKIQTVDLATCGWADNVSVGIVMFYFSTVSKVKGEFITVREAIETKP